MKPHEFAAARAKLGLTQQGMADALEMGRTAARTIRDYEAGRCRIGGPVAVAVKLMLEKEEGRCGNS